MEKQELLDIKIEELFKLEKTQDSYQNIKCPLDKALERFSYSKKLFSLIEDIRGLVGNLDKEGVLGTIEKSFNFYPEVEEDNVFQNKKST